MNLGVLPPGLVADLCQLDAHVAVMRLTQIMAGWR